MFHDTPIGGLMNDEFHSMISMYFFDFAIVDKPLNIRFQSVVPVRGGEKTYRGRGVLSVSFCFHNCKGYHSKP